MENPISLSSTTPTVKPKGILKNAPPLATHNSTSSNHLTWDEQNIADTEIDKDSLMKITEPKTPFVRYDAATDTVENMGDIPPLSLEREKTPSLPNSPHPMAVDLAAVAAQTKDNTAANAAMTASPTEVRRNSSSSRPGSTSRTSSRSTSFNLPSDDPSKAKIIQTRSTSPGNNTNEQGEIEEDEEMNPEAAAKHAAFVRARGRHYSNEAEAMKRAQQLLADEEDEDSSAAEKDRDMTDEGNESIEHHSSDSVGDGSPGKPNGVSHAA